ncbi:MAG TPA: S41 family peptidase [Blastocatellia bacterium]|nr:S41 family peptidase [Blastocatellia bacterium]
MNRVSLKNKTLPLAAVLIIVASTFGGRWYELATKGTLTGAGAYDRVTDQFEEALTKIQENYAGALDFEILGKASIQGMLHRLDPHCAFFTKQEFDDMQVEQSSLVYGIGVQIQRRNNRVYILSVTPGAPGHRAGLRYGDAIIAIDGQNVTDWSTEQVTYKVRGRKGAPIELTVERAGVPNPITVTVVRDEVKLPSVRNAFIVDSAHTGYIALTGGFSMKTDEEFTEALARLKQQGMKQLILDLRDNPGGLLDEAVKVTTKFLAPGQKIVEVRGRDVQASTNTYRVPDNNQPETMPVVVIVNRRSASASEIVAGALQDHDRALIVGETTFGKGLVQGIFKLPFGTGLVLTTAKYYTPTGRSIQRDYSNVSFYDYLRNRNEDHEGVKGAPQGEALQTDTGRPVYGGGGITPDVEVKAQNTSRLHGRIFSGVFDFVRQLVAGQINGFHNYQIAETQHKAKITDEEINRYPITEQLLEAFRAYIADKPDFKIPDEQFQSHLDYIRSQMRREIITAAYGVEAGDQVYLADDAQFRKAVESIPQARMLAEKALRARAEKQ